MYEGSFSSYICQYLITFFFLIMTTLTDIRRYFMLYFFKDFIYLKGIVRKEGGRKTRERET